VRQTGQELHLSKHEGAGNDFLVLIDPAAELALSADEVQSLCDRHRGIGADGVIRVLSGDGAADVAMVLVNADGTPAETSGNGLRCLAQAAVDAGMVPAARFTVATGGGRATVDYVCSLTPGLASATVDMGPVTLIGPTRTDDRGRRFQRAEIGNPHLVVECEDPDAVELAREGAALAAQVPGGVNVEFIAPSADGSELVLRVWERGVGETMACGSGSCAAAAVARTWGLAGPRVLVRNPGGVLEVTLGREATDKVRLGGPVRRVGEIVVDRATL
jgi:diaminopimelate epimerase